MASVLITVLTALMVSVITVVNRIERQAGSTLDGLMATGAPAALEHELDAVLST